MGEQFCHCKKDYKNKNIIRMMRRCFILVLRRGISQLCKHGAFTLTLTSGLVTGLKKDLRALISPPRVPVQSPSPGIKGAGRQQASGGAGEHNHHTWHALPSQPEVLPV